VTVTVTDPMRGEPGASRLKSLPGASSGAR
jgi:hypothetical protein